MGRVTQILRPHEGRKLDAEAEPLHVLSMRRCQAVSHAGWPRGLARWVLILFLEAAGIGHGGHPTAAAPDLLRVVEAYAAALMERGRDSQGSDKSPLVASALDRQSFRMGSFPPIAGIRGGDRILRGANPMHDENLYQILYALTILTGKPDYAREADRTLSYFFAHCQSPDTGLLAWGEHLGWDFEREALCSGNAAESHEFFRPWVLWDRSFDLAREPCLRFARGLWEHQIHHHETGDYSRHARWSRHETGGGNEYPRHGGFYIMTWARAYRESKHADFARAAATLLRRYRANSSPATGAIACCSRKERAKIMWPESNLSLAVSLTDSAREFPDALRGEMLQMAAQIDQVYLALKHDFRPGGSGFVAGANIDTLEPLSAGEWTHTELFATGYGKSTDAQVANLCHLRWKQLPEGEARQKFARLILASAERYLDSAPDLSQTVYPGPFGDVIFHLLAAGELADDLRYQQRARLFADMAVNTFLTDGSPLPRASSQNAHYEAVTRGDTLMMALLKLWSVENRRQAEVNLIYSDR